LAKLNFHNLQKAFDPVNHNILAEKLVTDFSINSFLVKLVASFLSKKSKEVKYHNQNSSPLPVHNEVPQGTFLDPLLFSNSLANEFSDR